MAMALGFQPRTGSVRVRHGALKSFERGFINDEKANTNTEHQVLMGGSSGVRAAVL